MGNARLTPLTESGILAAIAVLLGLMGTFLPVVGVLAVLLWALPFLVLVVRQGLRYGMTAAVAASLVLALFTGPALSLRMFVAFAPTGLALGFCFVRGFSGVRTFLTGLAASVAGKLLGLLLLAVLMGVNPWQMQLDGMTEAFSASLSVYESMGMTPTELARVKGELDGALTLLARLAPLVVLMMGLCDTVVLYAISPRVLARLGVTLPQRLPPFSMWRLPSAFFYLFALSLIGLYWGRTHDLPELYTLAINANMIAMFAGGIGGLSLLSALCTHFHVSRFLRIFLYLFVLLNGLFLQILAFTGLIDMLFDYRGRLARRGGR